MRDLKERTELSRQLLQAKLDEGVKQMQDSTQAMGNKLKGLLQKELEEYRSREKTRTAEMVSIFAAHNFYSNGFTPVELRTTLEDLGPTYVKIGQIMSSRPDLLPESYCTELEKLRQNVKPLAPEIARAVIEDETGKRIEDIFSEFRDKPLGSASIGQAHYGVLKDGTKVVTKVQRPLIADMMAKDFILLKKLATLVNVVTDTDEDEQMIDLVTVIDELEKVSMEELDFRTEAANTKFFKEHCIEDEAVISCPTVIDELTTKRVFTMTFVDGCSVAHKERLVEEGCDLEKIGRAIVNNYVHQVLDVGTFHADPHQGNIMVSHGEPYWIDFGMIGHVSKRETDLVQSMILSVIGADTQGLVNVIMSMGAASARTDREKLAQDVELLLTRYGGGTSISDINVSDLFTEVTDLCAKHHVKLPATFTMLARSVLAIEGVIEQLCPQLNLMEILSGKLVDRMKKGFDWKQTLLDAGKGVLGMGKKAAEIPGLVAETLGALAKGRTKINLELTGTEEPLERIGAFVKDIMLVVIACVGFLGACILSSVDMEPKTQTGMPILAAVIMTCSIALGIYATRRMIRKDK